MKALRRSHTSSDSSSPSPAVAAAASIPNHNPNSSPTSSSSPSSSSSASSSSWNHLKSVLYVVAAPANSCSPTDRIRHKSPWSRRKRIHPLSPQQWKSFFTPDGKLQDDGVKMLRKVRSGGIDPSIRAEVWPFLLGVKEYERLQRKCQKLYANKNSSNDGTSMSQRNSGLLFPGGSYSDSEDAVSARVSIEKSSLSVGSLKSYSSNVWLEVVGSSSRCTPDGDTTFQIADSSFSESSDESDIIPESPFREDWEENKLDESSKEPSPSFRVEQKPPINIEDFTTWQRIIRLDAVRANSECIEYVPSEVTLVEAFSAAEAVGLKDYDHLESWRIVHAARLVSILEAYALYDPEIGYCQGMGDLLSPIVTVIPEDHDAFWCFVGFMRKARHNFRLDEVGIRRQLSTISKIIKCKDSHLYKHLAKYQAEDCFFVYRMVLVLFRRELSFEQTLCLWEVIWADQAAIRARIGKSAWSRIRQRAPPTDDLLLYAIAASVLQRRKLIIEKYSSMDEIIRECNNMAGQLDVWKLLDDAHNLVVTLHDKIKPSHHHLATH
uniref:Rab-GAP TBC domain-containing protein n=1 Tax=Kalanchoe fedtschenkoi TaxID=63787 RepID=A0A7N0UAE9_KALFE